jgi:hypothetical protein
MFLNTTFDTGPAVIDSVFLDFNAIPGRTYTILYTDDLGGPWQAAINSVRATANVIQWIDAGPPKTDTHPTSKRFYRVILLP